MDLICILAFCRIFLLALHLLLFYLSLWFHFWMCLLTSGCSVLQTHQFFSSWFQWSWSSCIHHHQNTLRRKQILLPLYLEPVEHCLVLGEGFTFKGCLTLTKGHHTQSEFLVMRRCFGWLASFCLVLEWLFQRVQWWSQQYIQLYHGFLQRLIQRRWNLFQKSPIVSSHI